MLPNPPFSIIAAGICRQGLSPGDYTPGQQCTIQNQGTGTWGVVVDNESVRPGNCVLILSGGSGSNPTKGIALGQSQQTGRTFSFKSWSVDTGAALDVELQFIVVNLGT